MQNVEELIKLVMCENYDKIEEIYGEDVNKNYLKLASSLSRVCLAKDYMTNEDAIKFINIIVADNLEKFKEWVETYRNNNKKYPVIILGKINMWVLFIIKFFKLSKSIKTYDYSQLINVLICFNANSCLSWLLSLGEYNITYNNVKIYLLSNNKESIKIIRNSTNKIKADNRIIHDLLNDIVLIGNKHFITSSLYSLKSLDKNNELKNYAIKFIKYASDLYYKNNYPYIDFMQFYTNGPLTPFFEVFEINYDEVNKI